MKQIATDRAPSTVIPSRAFRHESWRRFQLTLDPFGTPHRLPAPGRPSGPDASSARA